MFSEFQVASSYVPKMDDSEFACLLEMMAFLKIPLQIEADSAPRHGSVGIEQLFKHHGIKQVTALSYNPTG